MVFWRFVNGKYRANSMRKIFGNRNEIKEDIFGRFFTCFGFETEREGAKSGARTLTVIR